MAFGTVLTRKWQPPVPLLTPLPRQLAAGGLSARSVALVFDPPIPMPTGTNVLGFGVMAVGRGLTYHFAGSGSRDSNLQLFPCWASTQPGTAVLLGWDGWHGALQVIGVLLVRYLAGPTFQPPHSRARITTGSRLDAWHRLSFHDQQSKPIFHAAPGRGAPAKSRASRGQRHQKSMPISTLLSEATA